MSMSSIKATKKTTKKATTKVATTNAATTKIVTKKVVKKVKEPLPDDNEEAESEEVKNEFETWDELEKACKENDVDMAACIKRRKHLDSIKKTMFNKMKKEASKGKRKKRNPDGTVQNSGVTKKIGMPPKFLKFVTTSSKNGLFSGEIQQVIDEAEYTADSHIARNTITKIIYDYIKFSELYDTKDDGSYDKRTIIPDEAIKTLFAMKPDDELIFSTFQTFVSTLVKTAPAIEQEEAPAPAPAPKATKKVTTKVAKKKVAKKKIPEPEPEEEEWDEGEEEAEEEEGEWE